jgi:hypothetical protein
VQKFKATTTTISTEKIIMKFSCCIILIIYTLPRTINSIPISDNNNDYDDDDDEVIDLSSLGRDLFGLPDYEYGKRMNMSECENPEECGRYLQGDLLVLKSDQRNGMNSEAVKWRNGEVPYVMRGKFSEYFATHVPHYL